MSPRTFTPLFLGGCCVLLTILWLPGFTYPVVSDTVYYAELGRSLWQHGTYMLEGVAHAKYLPLHAFLSYPLVALTGMQAGMHLTTLFGGFAVLITAFFLARRIGPKKDRQILAAALCIAILIHPAFILMSMVGSADLLFTALFLLSLLFFLKAEYDTRWYNGAFAVAGLASLARYNGIPLFALFLGWVMWKRPQDLRNCWFWCGIGLGLGIVSLWFARNALVFGNPFTSGYTNELQNESDGPVAQLISNLFYYSNPVHNVFPFFFVFAIAGVIRHARKYPFVVAAIITALPLSLIWWVQAIRFLFPAWVLLLFFAVLALHDLMRWSRKSVVIITSVIIIGITLQSLSICLYTYGACNAWFDRTVGIVPKNMHISSEGFYTWGLARDYINEHLEPGAAVVFEFPQNERIFRSDLQIIDTLSTCPAYRITQRPEEGQEVLFQTKDEPVNFVTMSKCKK